ncbi:MAG TPA: hypothetical protein VK604_07805 [Bryobacteraceae bacterium]|nr:hypothetical protein [Bryobacteraceae bacterium]
MAAPTPAKAQAAPISVRAAIDPGKGILDLNVFDGTRAPFPQTTPVLLTIRDGQQNQLYREYVTGPNVSLTLPIHNNFADNYSIVVWADGYQQAGFQPVKMSSGNRQALDLMLLPEDGTFHFAHAKWTDIAAKKPLLSQLFIASAGADPGQTYGQIEEDRPDHLACLLNITTAMEQIALPQHNPLFYFKQLDLTALAADRFFGYADAKLVEQVKLAVLQKTFTPEPAADLLLHPGATSSFKQIQFGEANVQLTFHEDKRLSIDGVDCVYIEPDMDYYKDPAAHALLEVIPNAVTHAITDPRLVYVLRWIAGRHAGVPEFDPLYTIE